MQHTLTGRTVSEIGQANIVCAFVFFSKSQSCTGTDLGAHDAVTTEEVLVLSEEVHTATFTFGASGSFSIELSHAGFGAHAFGKSQSMITVSGNEGSS